MSFRTFVIRGARWQRSGPRNAEARSEAGTSMDSKNRERTAAEEVLEWDPHVDNALASMSEACVGADRFNPRFLKTHSIRMERNDKADSARRTEPHQERIPPRSRMSWPPLATGQAELLVWPM